VVDVLTGGRALCGGRAWSLLLLLLPLDKDGAPCVLAWREEEAEEVGVLTAGGRGRWCMPLKRTEAREGGGEEVGQWRRAWWCCGWSLPPLLLHA